MLDRSRISSLVPHDGEMVLIDEVVNVTETRIECIATRHAAPNHPLRKSGRLSSVHAVEYAAQAAAIHGSLRGHGGSGDGYLAAVRDLHLLEPRLDETATLQICADRLKADRRGVIYRFEVGAEGRLLVSGRLTVMFA